MSVALKDYVAVVKGAPMGNQNAKGLAEKFTQKRAAPQVEPDDDEPMDPLTKQQTFNGMLKGKPKPPKGADPAQSKTYTPSSQNPNDVATLNGNAKTTPMRMESGTVSSAVLQTGMTPGMGRGESTGIVAGQPWSPPGF